MKIILLQDVKNVGVRGAVATVADGYAQNVLIPRKFALPATPQNLLRVDREKSLIKEREATDTASAKALLAEIDGKSVSIQARANPSGGLFEAIHAKQVAEALRTQLGVSIPEDSITLSEPIKKLSDFRAHISLHACNAELSVLVSRL
ncbi:MAG: 50S ribosomal protein L9 [bacterium]|nr:50S ribosomal protein L9 [bacterium]